MLQINESEVAITAIRAQGAGGQNVNKVSSAIHLRFDIVASTLPDDVKERLLALNDSRITKSGELIIKAQQHRTQDMNRLDAMLRLHEIVNAVEFAPVVRKATKPSRAAKLKRLDDKGLRSETKAQRSKVSRATGD
jgi:ribosome-associated protein